MTDQHFGIRNDNIAFLDYYEKFYRNIVFPYIDKHNVTNVIDLGDTFERRKFVNYFTLKRAKDMWFDQLEARGIQYDFIVGNHTSYFKNTINVNSPDLLFDRYAGYNIVDRPQVKTYDGVEIALIPWICQDNQDETMELLHNTKAQVLFGHLEIVGFEMYKGTYVDHGLESNVFSKFDLVASGHLHHKSHRGNIHYLGCPYEMTWSDYGDQKGFHVFDTDTRSLTFIPNPYTMFNKLYYDDDNHSIETLLDFDPELYTGTYVKVIVKEKNNPYWLDMFIDKLERANPLNMEIIADELSLQLEDESDIVDGVEDTVTILNKTIDAMASEISSDPVQVKKLLTSLYYEAVNLE